MKLRAVAYLRAPEQEGAPGREAYTRGLRAIEDWAAGCGAIVTGLDGAGDRVGFLRALTLVRQEEADASNVGLRATWASSPRTSSSRR